MSWVLFLSLCSLAVATFHPMHNGRPLKGFLGNYDKIAEVDAAALPVVKSTVKQLVDNFDPTNKATYDQRYWYNPNYSQNKSIAFLLIQGEGIAPDSWATNPGYTYQKLAALYGADVYQLEHRCFGFSRPYPDTTTKSLQVCTIAQALEDTHQFIQQMNKKMGYKYPKWVTFGGSYPGALSALFRQKYPADTVGAVASSAPMLWTLDFFQYAQVVNTVYNEVSAACGKAINTAFYNMQQLSLSNAGRQQLNTYFNLVPAFKDDQVTQLDVDNFFGNLYSYFQDVNQYTYDGRNAATKGGLNVDNLCGIMTAPNTDPIAQVNQVVIWYNQLNGIPSDGTFANSYSDMMTDLKNTTYDDEDPEQSKAAARGWMWLCCNELGVLQTTNQGRNIFQQTVTLNYFLDQCTQMFGDAVDVKYVRDHNYQTLLTYGGIDNYKTTNVVLPNGMYDPWHVLGYYNVDTTNQVIPISIQKAGHCSDMYPKYAGEPAELDSVREIINVEVAAFIGATYTPIKY